MVQSASPLNPAERLGSLLMAAAIPSMLVGGLLTLHSAANVGGGAKDALVTFAIPRSDRAEPPQPDIEPQPAQEESERKQVPNQKLDATSRRPAESLRLARTEVEISLPLVPLARASPASLPLPADKLRQSGHGVENSGALDRGSQASGAQEPPSARPAQAGRDDYGQAVYRRIRQEQRFEQVLRRQDIAGTVVVGFRIDRQGRLRDPRIIQSSGHGVLDRIALRHLAAASPFARPPGGAARTFQIPMTYRERD